MSPILFKIEKDSFFNTAKKSSINHFNFILDSVGSYLSYIYNNPQMKFKMDGPWIMVIWIKLGFHV